jgi:predicted  nucleic acid-binding Zn-ribbon protein
MEPKELALAITNEINTSMEDIKSRISALERSRTADVVAIKELTAQIHDIEGKMDRLNSNFRTLSGQFDSVLSNFDAWRRDLVSIMSKLATLEERSHNVSERFESMQAFNVSMNNKFDALPLLVGRALQHAEEKDDKPWYYDFTKWKEIGVGIAIVVTTVFSALNAVKLHAVELPPALHGIVLPGAVTPASK